MNNSVDNTARLHSRIKAALPFLFRQKEGELVWEWIARAAQWRVVASLDTTSTGARLRFETICLRTHQRVRAWSRNIILHGRFEPRVAQTAGWLVALTQNRLRCPRCRVPLDLVTRYDGQQFMGCPRWPQCNWTASIEENWYALKQETTCQTRRPRRTLNRQPPTNGAAAPEGMENIEQVGEEQLNY